MPPPSLSGIWDRGLDVLNTFRDATTNTILALLGSSETDTTESDKAEWWQHVGFASRPSKATKGRKSAQCIVLKRSDRDAVIASRDTRCQSLYASLGYGETCVYAPGEDGTAQGRIFLKGNGTVALYTSQGNVEGGPSVTIQVNADGSIVLANQYGALKIDSSAWSAAFGSAGAIQFTSTSGAIIAPSLALNAGSVSLGASATEAVVLNTSLQAWVTAVKVFATAVGVAVPTVAAAAATLNAVNVIPSTSVKAAT